MARMHPEDIEGLEGPTEGERKVFRFLREAARPDSDFFGWPIAIFTTETQRTQRRIIFQPAGDAAGRKYLASGGASS
jgi:hypothetical protein